MSLPIKGNSFNEIVLTTLRIIMGGRGQTIKKLSNKSFFKRPKIKWFKKINFEVLIKWNLTEMGISYLITNI